MCEQAGYMETTNQHNNETSCSPCAAGSEKTSAGLQPCEACQVGKYKSTAGTAACIDFPAGCGSVQGSTVCVMCPAGTFKEDGPGNCRACPLNEISAQGCTRSGDCKCSEWYTRRGSYMHEFHKQSCLKCPANALTCTQKAFTCPQYYTMMDATYNTATTRYRRRLMWVGFEDWPKGVLHCLCYQPGYMETTNQNNNKTSCTPCAAGSEKTAFGLQPCEACQAGKYKSTLGKA